MSLKRLREERDAARASLSDPRNADYLAFLKAKVATAPSFGFEISDADIHPMLLPHQRVAVRWAVQGGRRALFESFGLGKTFQQLEVVRIVRERVGGRGLIACPLGVRREFLDGAAMLGTPIKFIWSSDEIDPDELVLCVTNYESVRDGKIDPSAFSVVSLDEAAILRGFGGTKTFRELMAVFAGDDRRENCAARGPVTAGVPYRFVATATPSPNEYIELLAYAAYLGIMDVGAAKTRFFKRDIEKADNLTLLPHMEAQFWLWVASWALFITKPSDVDPSFSDEGYDLPPLDVRWHEIPSNHDLAGIETDGQVRLYKDAALGVTAAAREKRDSLDDRVAMAKAIVEESPDDHFLLWHDLEDERRSIEQALPGVGTVYGTQDLEEREARMCDFADGRLRLLGGKPSMLACGGNYQRHCHRAIFVGVGFQFHAFVQAIHRLQRFQQKYRVRIDLIHTEAERRVVDTLKAKWAAHDVMVAKMVAIVREYGLSSLSMAVALTRALGCERVEASGERYTVVNNDNVLETRSLPDNSLGLIMTSPAFGNQYEYSASYNDFGHTTDPDHFFQQMDFLTRELLRILQPGRLCVVHVKDRLVPGGINRLGFYTVYPFHMKVTEHFQKHGFAYCGMKTIVTDVVRENAQTYRLGWTEQCKDATKMGFGMSEYLLLFRKPPTDGSNAYADEPVTKKKADCVDGEGNTIPFDRNRPIIPGTGDSRSRWQIDAHGFGRSSGDRRLTPEEIQDLPHATIFQVWKKYSLEHVYNFDEHVRLGEQLELKGRLPVKFMLLQPPSWHPDVWADVARMRTLNTSQAQRGVEQHLCPLPIDLVERVIKHYSNPGDVVGDPFGGLLTVAVWAVGRVSVAWSAVLSTT
jgi:DNA modification methylase